MAGRRRARGDGAPRTPREPRVLDVRTARLAAADLLSRRAWTAAELTRRLIRRGAPPDVAAAVVTDLGTRGYVDDAAFARHFVETRVARGYGASRLAAELRVRGVAPALITAALGVLESGAQLDRARALARRRLPALRRVAPERAASRLRDHLLRRGYAPGVVLRVVREVVGTSFNSAVLE
jgi:regulatory protein